jgi:hypothetical protein
VISLLNIYGRMFLRKRKPNDDEQPNPHAWNWQATEREEVGRSKIGTAPSAECSKLTARMVDLSLREAQRDRTLQGTVPNKLNAISSPLLWPSTDVQRIAPPPTERAGRPGEVPQGAVAGATPLNPPQAHGTLGGLRIANCAVLYLRAMIILREMTEYWNDVPRTFGSWLARPRLTGSAVVGNLGNCWKSVQKEHRLATFRARIHHLTIAVQRTELIQQRTALLIGRWSSLVTTAQFLAKRLSARLRIITDLQPLRRLRYRCRKNLWFRLPSRIGVETAAKESVSDRARAH